MIVSKEAEELMISVMIKPQLQLSAGVGQSKNVNYQKLEKQLTVLVGIRL